MPLVVHHGAAYDTVHYDAVYEIVYHDAVYENYEVLVCDDGYETNDPEDLDRHIFEVMEGDLVAYGSYIDYRYRVISPAWEETVEISPAWDEQVMVAPAWDEVVVVPE